MPGRSLGISRTRLRAERRPPALALPERALHVPAVSSGRVVPSEGRAVNSTGCRPTACVAERRSCDWTECVRVCRQGHGRCHPLTIRTPTFQPSVTRGFTRRVARRDTATRSGHSQPVGDSSFHEPAATSPVRASGTVAPAQGRRSTEAAAPTSWPRGRHCGSGSVKLPAAAGRSKRRQRSGDPCPVRAEANLRLPEDCV